MDLVVELVNTRRISRDDPDGHDELATPTDDDLALARTVREGLRGLLAVHNDAEMTGDADAVAALEAVLPTLALRVTRGAELVAPVDARPATAALARVVGEAALARAAGTWERV